MRVHRFLLIAAFIVATPAHAAKLDDCLVGTWKPTNNGGAEYMQKKGAIHDVHSDLGSARLILRADGSFSSGGASKVSAADRGGNRIGGSTNEDSWLQGTWSVKDGKLKMKVKSTSGDAEGRINNSKFSMMSMVGHFANLFPSAQSYACNSGTLELRTESKDDPPVIQRYRRVK